MDKASVPVVLAGEESTAALLVPTDLPREAVAVTADIFEIRSDSEEPPSEKTVPLPPAVPVPTVEEKTSESPRQKGQDQEELHDASSSLKLNDVSDKAEAAVRRASMPSEGESTTDPETQSSRTTETVLGLPLDVEMAVSSLSPSPPAISTATTPSTDKLSSFLRQLSAQMHSWGVSIEDMQSTKMVFLRTIFLQLEGCEAVVSNADMDSLIPQLEHIASCLMAK